MEVGCKYRKESLSTTIDLYQPPQAPVASTALTPQQQHQLAAGGKDGALILGLRHLFKDLHTGDTAKILGPHGEDYRLSYDKMISLRLNSYVFSA